MHDSVLLEIFILDLHEKSQYLVKWKVSGAHLGVQLQTSHTVPSITSFQSYHKG